MIRPILVAIVVAAVPMTGCANPPAARVVSMSAGTKATHSEPVFYNDKHYMVDFSYSSAHSAYTVKVSGKGRSLGGTDGDRKIIEQIAISAVRHFACPSRLKGHVVPGTTRHTGTAWQLRARCA